MKIKYFAIFYVFTPQTLTGTDRRSINVYLIVPAVVHPRLFALEEAVKFYVRNLIQASE